MRYIVVHIQECKELSCPFFQVQPACGFVDKFNLCTRANQEIPENIKGYPDFCPAIKLTKLG